MSATLAFEEMPTDPTDPRNVSSLEELATALVDPESSLRSSGEVTTKLSDGARAALIEALAALHAARTPELPASNGPDAFGIEVVPVPEGAPTAEANNAPAVVAAPVAASN